MSKDLNKKDQTEKNGEETLYSYYSKLLNKPFDTIEELKSAEKEFKEEQARKEAARLAKKNAALIVNNAIDAYEEGKAKCDEAIKKAYNEYKEKISQAEKELSVLEKDANEKLNNWLEEHQGQGFHYTYKSKDGKVLRNYTYYNKRYDVFEEFDKFSRLLKDLWF